MAGILTAQDSKVVAAKPNSQQSGVCTVFPFLQEDWTSIVTSALLENNTSVLQGQLLAYLTWTNARQTGPCTLGSCSGSSKIYIKEALCVSCSDVSFYSLESEQKLGKFRRAACTSKSGCCRTWRGDTSL